MSVTVTIQQNSPQANAIIEMLRAFDFVTFKEPKKAKALATPVESVASDEILEEDENGIPLEHKDFILDLSRKINKKMTDRMRKHFNI
ncbi:hypothetical protein [Capnocytophaga leadbetteri]|jgi:hypothetical protein|uniref:hypothetical protein n=1 Tax=Capnocytophaga leadbetteri TaxID=327575 RepID=UPI0026EFA1B1|nr:hypothetical protein [Capnocytophaga leadbetteri]